MATTKRNTKGRTVATRAKKSARAAKSAKTSAKSAARPAGKAKVARKATAKPSAGGVKRSAPPKRVAATKPVDNREIVALKAKFQRERNGLQRNLTEAVREIGLLRHHELRATHLERQVAERDATIARLQTQLADLERRPAEPVYVHEVQQTLALSVAAAPSEDATDLDEFEDDRLAEEADLVADEE